MTVTTQQAAQLHGQAAEALRRGDGRAALAALEPLAGRSDAPHLLVVQAHVLLGDWVSAEPAVDRVLAIDPRHVAALIFKADCRRELGDSKAATAFYATALQTAAQLPQLSPALNAMLHRAKAALDALSAEQAASIWARLDDAGLTATQRSPRVTEALEILTGKRQIFVQQPQSFYFPGLPQIQFYDRSAFDWVPALEARTDAIRDELTTILADEAAFRPYVESDPSRPAKRNAMVGDPRWGAYYLWQGGERVADHADRCPQTMAALELAPIPQIAKRSPMALFSMLKPGMHIPAHTGFLNTRLICHLPLIVPPGCRFRVGNETRQWEEGRMLIFDDSIEHEAWNDGQDTRVVLLFEIWRPEIDAADRAALTLIFEHVAGYGE
ncbi:aspartyl/asparaginyl beta-hydroxylase (cupin superfamily) [Sphingomonas sp. BE123]|uniref:aspartyl/asparaginyl beta-hydroxylase domain-containing protein n=1 Tax=unclassified Sphingomonas TaxID=196159 RepID=UPI002855683E|nr:aspartyl/asparaginyl beta-hydroxylase domain-containing protein [Sphingomonas sp. BE123]MDR6851291.1 aspartyl/asparaginyl beta-hydroxylase (cupin superfamily) [Sphingomonas sp. BE123]